MELKLTAEEKLNFENSELKIQNLQLQLQGMQMQKTQLINDFCSAKKKKIEDFEGINLQEGVAVFKESKK